MPFITDQLHRELFVNACPQRIVSLVPSQTELLFSLGLGKEIAGITSFCTRPEDKIATVLKIGGPKKLNIPLIRAIKPDLIIANKEENERSQVEELMEGHPVYISNPVDLETALSMIGDVGNMVGRGNEAAEISATIRSGFNKFGRVAARPLKIAYLIWRKPYMVAGTGTFINAMLQKCGWLNAFAGNRYPIITADDLRVGSPDMILLSSEPYPFKEKHIAEFKAIIPGVPVKLVDGEMFSWYGSRLQYAPDYFISLINSINEA